jgi:VCBS repeat-containing protein
MTGHPFTFDDVSAPHLSTAGGDESIQRLSRYSITDMTSTGHILRSGPTDNNAQPAVQSTQTIKQSKINPVVTSTDQPGATTPFTTAANLVSTTTTSLTPIIITSIEQLDSIGVDPSMPLSGNYVLGNDIDASGFTFTPIGVASSGPFTGTLNGAGYSIDGLTDAGGLFFGIAGTIENLTLVDPTIIANAAAANGVRDPGVGALGYTLMDGASLYRIGVSGGSVSGTGFVGGLIGYNDGSIVTQSFSTASVTINDSGYAGGLVGDNDGAISACYSAGSVTGSPGATVGGLAGVNSFDYVTAGGSIAQSYSAGPISEGLVAGGLVGANQNPITNSVWDTQASGETSAVGITAYNGSLIGVAGLSSTQLQSGTLPAGFDPTVWGAAPGVYPYLLWSASLNRIPTATPSVVLVPTGYTLEVVAPGILADTSDPDGDVLTVSAVDGTAAYVGKPTLGAYGTLTLNANGSYIYQETQPLKVAVAQGGAFDAFTYTVSDGRGGTASSTLTFDISPATPVPLPTQTTPGVSLEIKPLVQVVVQSGGGPEDDLLSDGSRWI